VRQFVSRVEAAALGVGVTRGVTPDQQLVKVVYDQLKELMGGERSDLAVPEAGPQVILLAGLQGVGKTTAAGKLALLLREQGKKVLLVAADVYRPAAVDQLCMLGKRINVDVLAPEKRIVAEDSGSSSISGDDDEDDASLPLRSKYSERPPAIARRGLERALAEKYDAVIVDTAGRLQIDASMMEELTACAKETKPTDTLLVVDAMTGQEAAALAAAFAAAAPLTGVVLTKLDGDARGGAALSVRAVSGAPVKFVGTGEGLEALEPFYPDRLAGRILGMGDVLSLVERAERAVSEQDAEVMARKMMSAKFDFDDFLQQYRMVTGMGGIGSMMKMLPGMGSITGKRGRAGGWGRGGGWKERERRKEKREEKGREDRREERREKREEKREREKLKKKLTSPPHPHLFLSLPPSPSLNSNSILSTPLHHKLENKRTKKNRQAGQGGREAVQGLRVDDPVDDQGGEDQPRPAGEDALAAQARREGLREDGRGRRGPCRDVRVDEVADAVAVEDAGGGGRGRGGGHAVDDGRGAARGDGGVGERPGIAGEGAEEEAQGREGRSFGARRRWGEQWRGWWEEEEQGRVRGQVKKEV